jgi:DNA repair exonuclease SbcCD ATPase subunit
MQARELFMFRVKHLNNEHRKKKTMQTLLGAQYRQTLLFGDVNLNLNPGGIVTVSGKNLNVRRTGVEYDTNAVGKSVLFSSLANVLYERGALHESAKSKKELYGDALGCSRIYHRTEDGVEYCYEQAKSGKYVVYENGEPLKHDKVANSVSTMQTLFPVCEDAWHHLVVLSSAHPAPFMMAKPEARRNFFSELFNYAYFDELASMAKRQITEKSKTASKLEGFASSIETLRASLSQIPEVDESELESDLNTLLELQDKINGRLSLAEFTKIKKRLVELETELDDEVDEKHLESAKAYLEKTQDHVSKLSVKIAFSESKKKELLAYKEDSREFSESLESLADFNISEDPKQAVSDINALLALLELVGDEDIHTLASVQVLNLTKRDILAFRETYAEQQVLEAEKTSIEHSLAGIRKVLKNIKGHAKCPFCASDVDEDHFRAELKRLSDELDVVDEKLDAIVTKEFRSLARYANNLSNNSFCKSLTSGVDWCKLKKIEDSRSVLKLVLRQAKRLQDRVPPEGTQDVAELKDRLNNVKLKREKAQEYIDFANNLGSLATEYRKLKKKIAGLDEDEMQQDLEELVALKRSVEERQKHQEKRESFLSMIAQIKKDSAKEAKVLEDIPALEVLVRAYSTKGLRLSAISSIAQTLSSSLNENAHMLFSEPFSFDVNITDTRFDIMVDRSPESSDIRKLSKSEQRRFSMLYAYCLNELIPPSSRSNLIVLDEMEDGSSDVNRKLYREVFLPHLNSVVPNVFVVSPLKEMQEVPGTRTLFVVKDGDSSHVETEHPELITLEDVEYPIGD